ncbi:MAG: ACT domain-containing protein, partial [Dongiaceae bacterium]
ELKDAKLTAAPFAYQATHAPSGHITHRIEIIGDDSPGLIARLSEAFVEFGANIVRLNSERIPGTSGARYATRIAVSIPEGRARACLATVANNAAELHMTCRWDAA